MANEMPSQAWQRKVNLLASGYRQIHSRTGTPSMIGHALSRSHRKPRHASRKRAQQMRNAMVACPRESLPLGSARPAVRGFAPSIFRSSSRLAIMAAERALIMAHTTRRRLNPNCPLLLSPVGPVAAMKAASRAKGRANTLCAILISPAIWRIDWIGEAAVDGRRDICSGF